MGKIKQIIKSPYMIYAILAIKMITYYLLICVNITSNVLVLSTIGIFGALFFLLSRSDLKRKKGLFFWTYTFFSIIMFSDTMYYNYYNQTVSINQIWQVSNVAKVPSSFVATLLPASFLLVIDIPFIYYYFKKEIALWTQTKKENNRKKRRILGSTLVVLVLFAACNPFQNIFIKKINSVEFFSNHARDIAEVTLSKLSNDNLPVEEVLETVTAYAKEAPQGSDLTGIAEGKNLIVIQLEAFQNFIINAKYNGQEITPNLNQLLQKDTVYFDNYYSIIGKGNTADAEFSTLNSLYPVIDGESYRLFQDNTYNGLPWLLKDKGYSTLAFHGYEADFWNRKSAYPYQGIDTFYAMEDLDTSDIIGLGVSDKSMFHQTVEHLKEQKNPFFAFAITLTSHHPYELPEDLCEIELLEQDEGTKFGKYLQTVHYTDQAIGQFIEELKAEGLYENTVIALYGDHHGLNWTMDGNDETVGAYLGKTYDYDEMLKVPMMVHIPDSGIKETISTLGCQVDFLPTIANLMNLKIAQPYVLGQDLVNAKEGFAAFTAYLFDGSFACDDIMFEISREGIFEGSRAWNRHTQQEVNIGAYQKQYEKGLALKQASREILEQDLIADYITRE